MANVNSYPTVSDGLAAMIRAFEKSRKTGIVMVKKDVATFIEGLTALHDAALIIETMADRAQWKRNARRDNARVNRKVLEEALADGTVSILPVAPRATALRQDGEGGAA